MNPPYGQHPAPSPQPHAQYPRQGPPQAPYGHPLHAQPPYAQPYAQPPYAQPYAQPPYAQPYAQPAYAQPSTTDLDAARLLVAVGGCALFALSALTGLVRGGDGSGYFSFLALTTLQGFGLVALGVGLTGFRSLSSKIAAGALLLAATTIFVTRAMRLLQMVSSEFVDTVFAVGVVGWTTVAFAATSAALGVQRKRSALLAAGGGLFGFAAVTPLRIMVSTSIKSERFPYAVGTDGADATGFAIQLLAAGVTAVGLLLLQQSLKKPAR